MMTFLAWIEWNYVAGSSYYGALGSMFYNLTERYGKKAIYSLAFKWIWGMY